MVSVRRLVCRERWEKVLGKLVSGSSETVGSDGEVLLSLE